MGTDESASASPVEARAAARAAESLRVRDVWNEQAGTWGSAGLHWLEHPATQQRLHARTGAPNGGDRFQDFIGRYFHGRTPVERILTLGCGVGAFERGLAQYHFATEHDAMDIAEGAIQQASEAATRDGLDHVHYRVADLNGVDLPPNYYDVVFGISSVHHIAQLERLYQQVRRSLKPDGFFFLDEYIGPSQFQWPDTQVNLVNESLQQIPERFRRSISRPGHVKTTVSRSTIDSMNAVDPSEAIRSADIVPLLKEYFDVVEFKGYGGSLLHLALEDITGNFDPADPVAMECLEQLFRTEDQLIANGDLSHDFAVIVARAPQEPACVSAAS
jgi:SAM-dependent methyltransferase